MYTYNDLDSKNEAAKVNGKTKQKKQGLDATESELGNTDIQVEQLEVMSAENFDWKGYSFEICKVRLETEYIFEIRKLQR